MSNTLIGVLLGGLLAILGQIISNLISRSDLRHERLLFRTESVVDEVMRCKPQWATDSHGALVSIDSVPKNDRFASAKSSQSSGQLMQLSLQRLRFSIQDATVHAAVDSALMKIQYSTVRTTIAAAIPDDKGLMDGARQALADATAAVDETLDVIAGRVVVPHSVFNRLLPSVKKWPACLARLLT